MGVRGIVEIAPRRAALRPRGTPHGVDLHGPQGGEIDDDGIVACPEARHAVAAAAHGHGQLVFTGEVHSCDDVVGIRALNDHPGPSSIIAL